MIDGRFRVACCLKLFDIIREDCFVLFDDFPRKQYQVVLDYFEIIEKTSKPNLYVLKKKKNITKVPEELIKKYEEDYL